VPGCREQNPAKRRQAGSKRAGNDPADRNFELQRVTSERCLKMFASVKNAGVTQS